AAQANERGIELTVTAIGELPPERLDARDLVTVAGNLLDNAFDAVADAEEKHVWADFVAADGSSSSPSPTPAPGSRARTSTRSSTSAPRRNPRPGEWDDTDSDLSWSGRR